MQGGPLPQRVVGPPVVVVCATCGTHHVDPGVAELTGWRCARCDNPTLVRIRPPQPPQPNPGAVVAATGAGVALGAAIGGPPGALIGGALGLLLATLSGRR